jgi:hypothetical protein
MAIKHNYVSAVTDSGDTGEVSSNEWNADHDIEDATVTEAKLSISDNTTGNVSPSAHGFAPKGDGDTAKFLNANGAYSTPAGGSSGADLGKVIAINSSNITF